MSLGNTQGLPSYSEGAGADCEISSAAPEQASAERISLSRPFVERRRSAQVQTSWPEALDSLQRHLLGYETACNELTESEQRYRAMLDDAPIGIFQVTPDGQPVNLNAEMAHILGFDTPEQYLAKVSADESLRFFHADQWKQAEPSAAGNDEQNGIDLQIRTLDGSAKWVRFNLRATRDGSNVTRFDGTAEDVTIRKRAEIRTELLAYYDLMTGLPNRTLFQGRFNEVIGNLGLAGKQAALLLIEFDSFKAIKDSLGARLGDRLLQEIAERLRAGVGDKGIVANLGGAEFGVIFRDFCHPGNVAAAAEKILARLSAEYSLLGHKLNVYCSAGISIFPQNGEDYETLLKKADVAKNCAREIGPNNLRLFTEEMNVRILGRMRLEGGLRQALARNELYLEYQPQVDIRSGNIAGLEALLRWNSPLLGLVPPSRFIEIAESSSLIVPIGEWVLRTACAQAQDWQNRGLRAVPVAVNVSPVQFRQRGFCEVVRKALRDTGLQPKFLELELTESLLMTNSDLTGSTMAELRAMGVMMAIDDFGTGYSSLNYLRQFKVNRIKIARSFIKDVSTDPDDAAITIAIIKMARAMNLDVLAEGVETEDQLLFLRAQNCQTIQGFYFSRPLAEKQVEGHLQTGFSQLIPAKSA